MSISFPIGRGRPSRPIIEYSSLIDLLIHRSLEQPERLAYCFLQDGEAGEVSLTYRQLDQKARAIGASLQNAESSGRRVLLLYPPGLEYIAAFFGCLYAGAVAVPAYPPRLNQSLSRLQAIVPDCQTAHALTSSKILSRIEPLLSQSPELTRLTWQVTNDISPDKADDWQDPAATPDTVAFLQYTSGSTATPKGVMITHGNLLHNSSLLQYAFEYGPDSHCVSWLPVYHDMGLIGGVIQPLFGGFPCTLMSPVSFLQRPIRWLQAISERKATISGGPNFAYDFCVDRIQPEARAGLDLSSWAVAFNGSEPIRHRTLERFASAFKTCGFRHEAFFPCYGLAEATLIVSGGPKSSVPAMKTFSAKALERNRVIDTSPGHDAKTLISSGRVLPELRIVIVDPESLTQCEPGQLGEVWVSGRSVAKGYWNRPDDNLQVFNARLADTSEGPFLRTGDLGFLKDGDLFITGRLKDLIIIRGLNHYPQDIELTVQSSHASLRPNCGAAVSIDIGGKEGLVIVQEVERMPCPDFKETIDSICDAVITNHEIRPHAVVLVRAGQVPKTSSGKIRRRECRQRFIDGSLSPLAEWRATDTSSQPLEVIPQSITAQNSEQIQVWLSALFAAQFGISHDKIDPGQPIARYGLDSLQATELVHSIEIGLGVTLSMVRILQGLTIAQLAEEIQTALQAPPLPQEQSLPAPQLRAGQYPLSHGQQAFWYLHKLAPDSAVYNISVALRIRSRVEVSALRQAFQMIVNRHASLRTTFAEVDGQPVQRVADHAEVAFNEYDASGWAIGLLKERLIAEAHRPFDLQQEPPFRVSVFSLRPDEHVLLLVVHHIITDFWSLVVMAEELGALYPAIVNNAPIDLAALPLSYIDHVGWQSQMLAGIEGARLWGYWQTRLSGDLPVLNLPTDRPRPPVQTYSGASQSVELNKELSQQVKQFSQAQSVTLYTTLMAAFQILLHRYSGQDDIIVGSLVAGRGRKELTGVMGYFVNPVVLRAELSGNPAVESFVQQTRKAVLGAFEHQDYPFPLLVERLQPQRDPSRSPIFQVLFIFQKPHLLADKGLAFFALGEPGASMELGGLALESLSLEERFAQFDLTVVVAEVEGTLRVSFEYNTDLFNAPTIARMLSHYATLLKSIVANPARRVSDLPLLTEHEQRQVLREWNATGRDYEREAGIHTLFETQANKSPDAVAVISGGQRLSYADLNCRANQLAHLLQASGVGPETPVGVCMERGLEMIIGLLAVMKAGGAFVPLDPTYPKERLALVIEDSGTALLLTQRRLQSSLPNRSARIICLDSDREQIAELSDLSPQSGVTYDNIAYVLYTSGSTGKPKGVMVTHRSVVNFFAGMDERVGCHSGDTMWAVTSISFDISILELFWTLTRGAAVEILSEQAIAAIISRPTTRGVDRGMQFSLFYFASNDSDQSEDKYRLLFEGARFADKNGFDALWTPERHFHAFGGLYPNPSVMSAALAVITERIKIRAGSVVLPLHSPIRVAEEWALVDNLSRGRVAIAFASGWHSDDFAFFPDNYPARKEIMFRDIEAVQKLWRGEAISARGGAGNDIEVKIFPKPIQKQLPIWITAAGTPETFIKAGEIGANVLTHLLGQSVDEVTASIAHYRAALANSGRDPQSGIVTLMLHTFLGDDLKQVRETVREPFTNYLKTSVGLIANMVKNLNLQLDLNNLNESDMDALLSHAFNRYFDTSALFGTVDSCAAMVERLKAIGVDEIACLIDFGVDADSALAALQRLDELKILSNDRGQMAGPGFAVEYPSSRPSLMQCTPSMMGMLMLNPGAAESLKPLRGLLLGGEPLPAPLVRQVKESLPCRVINMYGPTETTIWSATHELVDVPDVIPIGRPIANTQIYILDQWLNPVPPGVAGSLYIGGDGLARGYLDRPDLTAEKFIPAPFNDEPGARIYDTGDLAMYSPDGEIHFLGRLDNQVKIRGFRIELQEIEVALARHAAIKEAVVTTREDGPGDKRLVAYIVVDKKPEPSARELRSLLKQVLPDYMVPSVFVTVDRLPLTPNGKIDRKALPAPGLTQSSSKSELVAPRSNLERVIAQIWRQVLKLEKVGVHDNFFDLGGHSLLMAQAHSLFREKFKKDLPLIKLLEHSTISSLARYLVDEHGRDNSFEQTRERARRQRQGLKRQKQNLIKQGN